MKRKILYSCLSLVLIFTLTFFAVPVKTSSSEDTEIACSSLAAGRIATKDGSVLFGHNEDDGGKIVTRLHLVPRKYHEPGEVIEMWDITLPDGITKGTIPQKKGWTWAYIWSEMPGFSFSDSYLNEWGVAIASDNCGPSRETNPERTPGIGYWLRRLVPERATTAREGVEIMGAAVEEYGYNAPGRTYIVADPKEAWLFSAVYGKHWCAQRVPNRHVAFIPNYYTIREVEFGHPDFKYCKDLKSYAASQGWYTGGPFDFAKVYGGTAQGSFGNKIRHWGALRLLTGIEYPNMDDLPFSVEPNRKLTVKDLADVLRTHYEGTDYDQTKVGVNGDPHHTSTRVICTASTQESFVMQLRRYLPSFIGNIYWRTQGRPCEGVYVPIYSGILEIPTPYRIGEPALYNKLPLDTRYYDPDSAYWVFNKMDTLIDDNYTARKALVRDFWDDFEATEFELQDEIEMTVLKIYMGMDFPSWGHYFLDKEKDYHEIFHRHEYHEYLARWFLTRYTESTALNAYYNGLGFIEEFEP
jgi:dipeptidase